MLTNKILIPVSTGELLDKITILKIKLGKIKNEEKIRLIKQEFAVLEIELNKLEVEKNVKLKELFEKLMVVNKTLWEIEDNIRSQETQKKLLKALVISGENIFSSSYTKQFRLTAASTTQKALAGLIESGIVEKTEGRYFIGDPFFKRFITHYA